MRWALWNNPLVVTSFQLRLRRGSLYTSVVLYLLLWASAGMAWWYYVEVKQPRLEASPVVIYFMALLIVQSALSAILAGLRAAAAMKNEVLSKTLDFQRIAAVSPWEIMIGKLFGEPAVAYLLAIATVPIAIFCTILGIHGGVIGPLEVLLIYVNILTTAIMFGAMSLQHRLHLASEKSSGAVPGFGFVIGIVCAASSILFSAAGPGRWMITPWAAPLAGLLTPIGVLWGVAVGKPWEPGLFLFDRGFKIPFLLVAPVAQIAVALLSVQIMARRLVNTASPTLSKSMAYCFLIVVDFLAVGVLQASVGTTFKLGPRVTFFCLIHLLASFIVIGCVTPNRELLETWAWRWRGKKPWSLDEWLGERSLNTLVLITCCLIGALGVGALVLMAGDSQEGNMNENDWQQVIQVNNNVKLIRFAEQVVPLALGLTCLIIFTFGTIYQWMVTVASKYGSGAFILACILIVGLPAVAGAVVEARKERLNPNPTPMNEWLELSPLIHYVAWCGAPLGFPNMTWLALLYAVLALASLVSLRRRVRRIVRRIDTKLVNMGVIPLSIPIEAEAVT